MDHLNKLSFHDVDITGGFWKARQELNRKTTIWAVRDRFEDTWRFKAFHFGYREGGDEPKPHYFWDSDVAKWLESAADIISKHPDPVLEAKVEEVIDCIEAHQDENGYFNIYHTVVEPELRFRNQDHHELYCLGHLIEAAVAYYEATGRDRLLNLLDKYIDLVIRAFVTEKTAGFDVPGHEEIELALYRLYECRPDRKYLELANHFINKRGTEPAGFGNWCHPAYLQNHLPVRQQKEAMGHSVRACYLYSGMADEARLNGDEEMLETCRALFDDITKRKMYITGGIGSSHNGEAFTIPYDLPNDTAYAETCAAISLSFFANRMKDMEPDAKYADVIERTMYNGILSGLSLDGRSFFYENPLEINLSDRHRHISMTNSERLPITQRLEVFGCSCCPPNVTRYLASIGDSVCSYDDERIYIHQYMPCDASIGDIRLTVETEYPVDGRIKITLRGAKGKKLYFRIPGWCREFTCGSAYKNERGYAEIAVDADEFTVCADFHIRPVPVAADSRVRADAGKVAVMYGPLVYCAEGVDNPGARLADIRILPDGEIAKEFSPDFDCPVLSCSATVSAGENEDGALYAPVSEKTRRPFSVKLIPYFAFANRGESDMRVWLGI
ncbi:MAG: glycoside hydrolase family 127 protein [Clostridia bacterium]|nr:glycoside hydrolase family 127 protein [Clostridia bacterium]